MHQTSIGPAPRKKPFLQHRHRIVDLDLVLSDQKDIAARFDARFDGCEAASKIREYGNTSGLQRYVRLDSGSDIVLCDFYKDIELVTSILSLCLLSRF